MKNKIWLLFVLFLGTAVGLVTSMAFTPQDKGISETHDPMLEAVELLPVRDPRLQKALRLMLTSDQRWQWVHLRARYTEYDFLANMKAPSMPSGKAMGQTTFIEEIEIHQPFEVHYRQFLLGEAQPRYEIAFHNGQFEVIRSLSAQNGEDVSGRSVSFNRLRRELALLPRSREQIQPGMIVDHPLTRVIPARSIDMLFPTWIAQQATSQNRLFFTGEDEWLGRPVYRIRLEKPGGGTAVLIAWVDQQTGVLLRYRYEVAGTVLVEYEVQKVAFK